MPDLPPELENELRMVLADFGVVRRGVVLAEAREKVPSYAMELRAVLGQADLIPDRILRLVFLALTHQEAAPARPRRYLTCTLCGATIGTDEVCLAAEETIACLSCICAAGT